MEKTSLSIGELAREAGVTVQTLRYYEKRGLVKPAARRGAGYREYAPEALEEVRAVRWAQGLGFRIEEIVEFMKLLRAHRRIGAPGTRALLADKLKQIDQEIERLGRMRETLDVLHRCRCTGKCPRVPEYVARLGARKTN